MRLIECGDKDKTAVNSNSIRVLEIVNNIPRLIITISIGRSYTRLILNYNNPKELEFAYKDILNCINQV